MKTLLLSLLPTTENFGIKYMHACLLKQGHQSAVLYVPQVGHQVRVINKAIDAEADVVILGSSRAMHSYDDRELTRVLGARVHNAGLDGRGVLFSRGLLALISQRHAPKLVVLDVAYSDDDRSNAYAFAPYYGRSPIVDSLLTEGDWREHVLLLSRSFRMNGVALAILGNLFAEGHEWGFVPISGRLEPNVRVDGHPARPLARPKPFVEENLRALVAEARSRGAELVFCESPSFGDPWPADVRALYERVAAASGIPYLRIPDDELPGFGPAMFKDRGRRSACASDWPRPRSSAPWASWRAASPTTSTTCWARSWAAFNSCGAATSTSRPARSWPRSSVQPRTAARLSGASRSSRAPAATASSCRSIWGK